MTVFRIPVISGPQRFSAPLGNATYKLSILWRDANAGGWLLDIDDAAGKPLVHGIPLVTGADLLAQHRHLGIPGRLYVMTDGNADAVPTFQSLGQTAKLYFVSDK